MYDSCIQVFPDEIMTDITREFYAYFERKKKKKLSICEARMLVDYVSGPVPAPKRTRTRDYTKPRVKGGGMLRPSKSDVKAVYSRFADDEPHEWDAVFDELLKRIERNVNIEKLVRLTFWDKYSELVICDELDIGRSTYYRRKKTVLELAGVIALKKGALKPWKC